MKRFLTYCVLFILPIALLFIAMEIIVGNIPNSYSYKYHYVKTNGDKIQALVLGHSHLYDGFKPESFCLPAFNLCNSSQTYIDNYYLLLELLPYLPELKVVIMPIGYMDVGVAGTGSKLTDRSCYYHKYMNLNYDGLLPIKYRLECFNPELAREKIYLYYFNHSDIVGCDSLGRRNTHNLSNREHELGYVEYIRQYTLNEHDSQKLCLVDEEYLIRTFNLLMENNISIVLVSPPYYWNHSSGIVNMEQKRFITDYMLDLCKKYPVHYLNLESDTSYEYDDFFDETHLSEIGAEKFTQRLNAFVKDMLSLPNINK